MKNNWYTSNSIVLFQNKYWSIEKIRNGEIVIVSKHGEISHSYFHSECNMLYVDRKNYPKYIEVKAIELCKKYVHSIYCETDIMFNHIIKAPLQKEKYTVNELNFEL